MSGIIAIYHRDGQPVREVDLAAMLEAWPERGPDGTSVKIDNGIALGHQLFRLLPEEAGEIQPLSLGNLVISADARLDNRLELAKLLGIDARRQAETSDAMLILLGYRHWGEQCLERFLGDFAFILWDGDRRRLFAARDALGARDLHYFLHGDLCLLASSVSHILAHPNVSPKINDEKIATYLAALPEQPESTFFQDIYFLPPAHGISITSEQTKVWRYWDAKPQTVRCSDERDYSARYRELLTEAVRCRLRIVGEVGISLSGGLDSPTLAALAAPLLPEMNGQTRLKSFSYSFDELESCDERIFIRPVAERYNLETTYIPCDHRWSFKDIHKWPVSRDYVISDVYAWLPDAVRRSGAQEGIKGLLAGYFGDTLMGGGHYWALDMARDKKFSLLAQTARANWGKFDWRDSFFEFGLRRFIPLSISKAYRRVRPRKLDAIAPGIHQDLLSRIDLRKIQSPLSAPDKTPPGFRQRYQVLTGSNFSQSVVIRHQYNRCGMELLEPYYDRRLVEYVLSIPAYVLGRPGSYRRLHREAMVGLLPEEVRLRPRRTSFVPLLRKGLELEMDALRRLMTRPLVVERGYIRADWLASQLAGQYEPSPDWSMLFKSIFLELWLQRYWN